MMSSDEDYGKSRRLVQRTRYGRTGRIHDGRIIRRSDDAMCDLHHAHEDEERGFLGLASKPMSTVYQWFDPKINWAVCQ
jgi:hypothetical protein